MIPDNETNTVYFSNASNYDLKDEVNILKKELKDRGIECLKILGTKDYFCRDYMPVQKDMNTFIQFRFRPDYLLNHPVNKNYVTDVNLVRRKNSFLNTFNIINSDIILDGGNIIKWKDKVIITDKIFDNNQNIPKVELTDRVTDLLNAHVIIVPKYPGEETGHADGLVRFKDADTVITICLEDEPKEWVDEFREILSNAGLTIKSLPKVPPKEKEYSWGYINYLQVGKLIVLPKFGYKSDTMMEEFYNEEFKGYKVITLSAERIIGNGGVLNCFTWNIQR
jgi:agmatine deiminase